MADTQPSGGNLGFLKHKIGPVPIWIIAVSAVALYYWYMHYGPGAVKKQQAATAAQQAQNAATAVDPATGQTYASELANLQAQLNAASTDIGTNSSGSSRWRNRGTTTSPVVNGTTTTPPPATTVTTPATPVTTTPVVTSTSTGTPTGTSTGTGTIDKGETNEYRNAQGQELNLNQGSGVPAGYTLVGPSAVQPGQPDPGQYKPAP